MERTATTLLDAVGAALAPAGYAVPLQADGPISGGCINEAMRARTADGHPLFVKTGGLACADQFAAEALGLGALSVTGGPRVPVPLGHGTAGDQAWLALEYIDLRPGAGDPATFGRALATMHAATGEAFGWQRDNHIGSTPQPNGAWHDWTAFWRNQRLGHQLDLAEADGHRRVAERGRRLAERLGELLAGHAPAPSPLHGDLWAGNAGYDEHGRGTILDPAFYYGDREADLAMTELFGGFPSAFYAGYREAWPLDAGYAVRRTLYNLYHVLNHAHLFGGGYAARAGRMIDELLVEVG